MLSDCLYCGHDLADRDRSKLPRPGLRIAYDPAERRVWTVCDNCWGWNLWPRADTPSALTALERVASTRARLLFEAEHIALLETPERELIRVGDTPPTDRAWWRYGRELWRRAARYRSSFSRLGTATYQAVSFVGRGFGAARITGDFRASRNRHADILRWRGFGSTAWQGRAACPWCGSALLKLFYFRSHELVLLPSEKGLRVGMPCLRCDARTTSSVHPFEGPAAERVLRRVLAWQNIAGATRFEVQRAVRVIEASGSTDELIRRLAGERTPLHALGDSDRLALEICVNERAEHDRLASEAAALEAAWQQADGLAAIVEEL